MKILLVAGARPNFMKIAPIIREIKANQNGLQLEYKLVHTGQHYDFNMSESFFADLGIQKPDFFLSAGEGSHSEQTAKIMVAFERVCLDEKPDVVLVVGDVNSTLACSIVAKKLLIKVAHVEAGLRSFDLCMPEEINRMVTDSITDYFFTTEQHGNENLLKEGKPQEAIHYVGHVMIDNLLYQNEKVLRADNESFQNAGLKASLAEYLFLTLHRPSNVDNPEKLSHIISALNQVAEEIHIIFPVHPRTRKMLDSFDIKFSANIIQLKPLGYQEALYLWKDALGVFTDSGGLQEETTGLGVPCFTIRDNTERPVTVEEGTNTLIGTTGTNILAAYDSLKKGNIKTGSMPELWDGKAAQRIVDILIDDIASL
ncbi:non-hydrolyzing UDP-N-acetylglucosamine 2-epimerase [Desulfoluna spongiiphila]|uniref:UDP-N-acetylglucosamine 2-epimerase (Non-hydrolysing) n=1 Tax=Desulfoluna spongiiphila TaxID=419481 RepID=A0A1G5IDH4_9BACT|nr:UDP-N-acetylglucosamine 2-epimerase (non-hydrolyzing) [Desulfoluna spongiiphila]SCY73730.1 UDP-N-acetylglucosamine 2-epimerase (non-hydrolysing) [Desulfoluna spongiiphila]